MGISANAWETFDLPALQKTPKCPILSLHKKQS